MYQWKLKELMKEKGFTQHKLAEVTGLCQPHIARLCKPPDKINFENLEKLCDALNCTPNDILGISTH